MVLGIVINTKIVRGYTLIELVLVIAIVAVLSIFVVVKFGSYRNNADLGNAKAIIIADLREVIAMAQNGETTNDELPNGYGVNFTIMDDSHSQYADINDDNIKSNGDTVRKTVDLSSDELIEDVKISECAVDGTTASECDFFVAVEGQKLYINGEQTATELKITLQSTRTEKMEVITINRVSGRIE